MKKLKALPERIADALESCQYYDSFDTKTAVRKIMRMFKAEIKKERELWRDQS